MALPWLRIAAVLIPTIRKLAQAARKDSDGGKKITKKEIREILLGDLDDIVNGIEKKVNA